MKIAAVVIPERGHINPQIGTLRALERRGHQIEVFAVRDLTSQLASAGLAARARVLDVPPPPGMITSGRDFAERLRDAAWLRGWIKTLLVDMAPAQVEALEPQLAAGGFDAIVADPMVYAAPICAARLGLPWAGLSSSLNPVTPRSWRCDLTDTLDALTPAREALFARFDAPPPRFMVSDAVSPWLDVAFTVDDYAPRAAASATHVFSVGSPFDPRDPAPRGDEPPFDFDDLARDRPVIFCSFGSQAFYQPALFLAVFEASVRVGAQVVASAGDLADDEDFVASAPRGAIVCRYVPQLPLLARASAVVSHGGANSAVETLSHRLPLLLLPLCNDQPLQARFLAASGAGRVVDPSDATPSRVAEALSAIVREGPERAAARRIGDRLASAGGPSLAADLIERLAATRAPLRADAP